MNWTRKELGAAALVFAVEMSAVLGALLAGATHIGLLRWD